MALRLRVPRNPLRYHTGRHPHCYHQEEGYVEGFLPGSDSTNRRRPASFLEPLKGGKVPVEIYIRGKDADENAEQLKKCVGIIKSSGVGNRQHHI
jgi:hypothetical protein